MPVAEWSWAPWGPRVHVLCQVLQLYALSSSVVAVNSYRSALCVCEGAVQLMGFSTFKNPISRNMISSGAILLQQLIELDIQTVYFEVRRQKNQSRSFLCLCWKQEEETEVELFMRVQIG